MVTTISTVTPFVRSKPKILVTGATGKTGSAVVSQLCELGWPVRALVRTEDARSERLMRLGAEVVVADLFDPEQMVRAMQGVARAYFCPPFHPHMLQAAVVFAVAAKEAKLEAIVGLTQWLAAPAHPSLSSRQHWLADHLFALLPNIAHTVINPGFFAEYPYLAVINYAAHLGLFPFPADGESRNAPPSNDDIARVSVAALLDPAKHAGKTYRPTGPQLLSVQEMVQILSQVLKRRVIHIKLPISLFFKAARMDGTSQIELSGFRYYIEEQNRGAFAFGAPTTHVLEVTGKRPEDFATIVRRYVTSRYVQQTLGNQLRTLAAFMTVPFRAGFNPKRFERELGSPLPTTPRFALDSAYWKAEHSVQDATLINAQPVHSKTNMVSNLLTPDEQLQTMQ